MICCICAGEDGVAHGICQTDASVTSPNIICCFCTGEDGVAHGICQTDASVIIASHDLVPRLAAVLHQAPATAYNNQ
jgi:hypothetical protein